MLTLRLAVITTIGRREETLPQIVTLLASIGIAQEEAGGAKRGDGVVDIWTVDVVMAIGLSVVAAAAISSEPPPSPTPPPLVLGSAGRRTTRPPATATATRTRGADTVMLMTAGMLMVSAPWMKVAAVMDAPMLMPGMRMVGLRALGMLTMRMMVPLVGVVSALGVAVPGAGCAEMGVRMAMGMVFAPMTVAVKWRPPGRESGAGT